jgi:hypothetical protein
VRFPWSANNRLHRSCLSKGRTVSVPSAMFVHYAVAMNFEFSGKLWYWRGPAPWYCVTVPAKQCRELMAVLKLVT